RIVDLCERLATYLVSACSDPGLMALARNHAQCWRDPGDYDRAGGVNETGPLMVLGEELHFQAIVARTVRGPAELAELAAEAVDSLRAGLDPSTLPAREEIDAVLGLDLAGAAALRANLLGRTEQTSYRISAETLAVLREYGEVPANLTPE